jgi:hypothetical protein
VNDRIEYLNLLLTTVESAWPRLSVEIESRIADKTLALIAKEDEQARGAIKALKDLLELPDTLKSERAHITAELSERDSAS